MCVQTHYHSGWRGWVDRHPNITLGIGIVCLFIAINVLFFSGKPSKQSSGNVYFFDMDSGELFAAQQAQIMPISNPNSSSDTNTMSVRAHVFSCGSCNEKEQFIGYLQTHNPHVIKRMQHAHAGMKQPLPLAIQLIQLSESPNGHLVQAFDSQNDRPIGKWYGRQSRDADMIVRTVQNRCEDGQLPKRCEP